MKFLNLAGVWWCSVFLMMGCATTQAVVTDYDREADFSQYNTFFWSDEFHMQNNEEADNEPLFYNTLNKKRLKQAIQREMEGRGYTLSSENPDLLVNAQVLVEERNTNQTYYPYSPRFYYWGGGHNANAQRTNKEGDIVIDLIDQNKHQLVWQGYASGVLDIQTKNREEAIRDAVSIIFAEYGRRAGQNASPQNQVYTRIYGSIPSFDRLGIALKSIFFHSVGQPFHFLLGAKRMRYILNI